MGLDVGRTVIPGILVALAGAAVAQESPVSGAERHEVPRGHWSAVVASPVLDAVDGPGLPVLYLLSFAEDLTAVCTVDALGRLSVARTFDWALERPGGTVRPQAVAFADGGRTVYVFDHRRYDDADEAPVVKEYRWTGGTIAYVGHRAAREVPLPRERTLCAVAGGRVFRIDDDGTIVSGAAAGSSCVGQDGGAP